MLDFHALFSAEGLVSLVSLTVMEIVLGIDNVLLVAILSQKVKPAHRKRVRQVGIGLALVLRILLLFALTWLMGLTKPLFTVLDNAFSGRDLVLLAGGLFLIYKATTELYERIEHSSDEEEKSDADRKPSGSVATVFQMLGPSPMLLPAKSSTRPAIAPAIATAAEALRRSSASCV